MLSGSKIRDIGCDTAHMVHVDCGHWAERSLGNEIMTPVSPHDGTHAGQHALMGGGCARAGPALALSQPGRYFTTSGDNLV
jgi:hypothetical protein